MWEENLCQAKKKTTCRQMSSNALVVVRFALGGRLGGMQAEQSHARARALQRKAHTSQWREEETRARFHILAIPARGNVASREPKKKLETGFLVTGFF